MTYKWDATLPPYSSWRIAFQHGLDDWDAADTLISLVNSDTSVNLIKYQYDDQNIQSYTIWHSVDGVVTQVTVIGNPWWDIHVGFSNNQRRSVCAHEIGHLQLIGHEPENFPTDVLMSPEFYLSELEYVYTPRTPDITLVKQAYP